nr:hypothetical protein [Tanacetum cinerariifolium]
MKFETFDVLVASEFAFSTSGRVLSIRRIRLTPTSLEMCMCLKDHLDAQERKQDKSTLETLVDFKEEILDAEVQANKAIPLSDEEIALDAASSEGSMFGPGLGGEEAEAEAIGGSSLFNGSFFCPSLFPAVKRVLLFFRINYNVGPQGPPHLRIQYLVLKIGGNGPRSGHFGACLIPSDERSLVYFFDQTPHAMVLVDHTRWKLRHRQWTSTTEQLIEEIKSTYDNAPNLFFIRIHHGGKFLSYPGRMYVSGRVDIFDMVDIDLFTVVALNMMVLKLGYTGESEPMFYNYLIPLTSLDVGFGRVDIFDMVDIDLFTVVALNMMVLKLGYTDVGLYALVSEEDVRCLATLVRSFKFIEVYIEHGVTVLDSYLRAPRFRATLKDISDESACSIVENRTKKMLLLTCRESSETTKEPVYNSGTPSSLPLHDSKPLEPDVGPTQEPILAEVSTQEPIMVEASTQEPIVAEVSTKAPIMEEIRTQEFSVEDVIVEDYANDDDDVDEDFLVDEENEIVEPDVDVHLFGISMDPPFDNIGITNLVSDDVLEGEDLDVINADGFDSDPGNDEERNYLKRRLAELRTEMKGVINASGQCKYSFYTSQKLTSPKEAKDRVYLHSIESRRNLKLYKNDSVKIRARCEGKVPVFTMSQGTGPTGPYNRMEGGPSGSSGPTTMSKKGRIYSTNPNTTVKIVVERNTDPSLPTRVFQRIYVCLGALKLGFRGCRRDLLGLDDAFTKKGPFLGQVLVAVGLDSNNGIYPLVEAETKSSWCWFLQCLGDDIDLHPNSNFTFINDRKKGWCGQAYKDLLWRAASATNVRDFEKCMLELKTMNPKAHEWLNKIPAEHWARSHFLGRAKFNLLLNNICEVFNGKIVRGRDKPVITLLEYIMEYCMKRIMNARGVTDKCNGPLTHTELTGIPCKNVVAACWNMALNDQATTPRKLEGNGSASRQAQQTEPLVGQDGSGGSGAGAVIGLSATAAGEGGAGDPCSVPLNNNIGKQIGDFVDMPSEAVEKRMDANVPDEIDGAKGEQVPNHVVKKGNFEFLVCKEVADPGGQRKTTKEEKGLC